MAAAIAVLLVACTTPVGQSGGPDRLAVVATTTQVGSILSEIGGDDINLTTLLQPGMEAHDFELTPELGAAVEQADLIFRSGARLETWLDEALETIGRGDNVRDLSEGIELRAGAAHDDGAEDEAHESAEESAHEDEVDPHYWLTAPNAIRMVENARDALTAAAPDVAAAIDERAAGLIGRLEAADAEIRMLIGEIPEDRRLIVTDHDAMGYFLEEYGLEFGGSVFPSFDVSSEPSAQDIEELVGSIREHDIHAIFTESAVNPALSEAVAAETDAEVVDDPLYTDSLGPPGSGADTLDGMLLHDATVLHDALVD